MIWFFLTNYFSNSLPDELSSRKEVPLYFKCFHFSGQKSNKKPPSHPLPPDTEQRAQGNDPDVSQPRAHL